MQINHWLIHIENDSFVRNDNIYYDSVIQAILLKVFAEEKNTKMPKLIILRGNSGSGKTTVAKALQEKFERNTMLLSHDMVRMEILHAKDAEALPLLMLLLRYSRQNSNITILEGILPVEVYMPLFKWLLKSMGRIYLLFIMILCRVQIIEKRSAI